MWGKEASGQAARSTRASVVTVRSPVCGCVFFRSCCAIRSRTGWCFAMSRWREDRREFLGSPAAWCNHGAISAKIRYRRSLERHRWDCKVRELLPFIRV